MINNGVELQATSERVRHFQQQVERLRQVEPNAENYRASASGFLAEIDRMNLEIREYLWLHPTEVGGLDSAASRRGYDNGTETPPITDPADSLQPQLK